jgi:uncharacterized membrane protein YkgB
MNRLTKTISVTGADSPSGRGAARDLVNALASVLNKLGILRDDADYHLIRAAMVIIFFFFGYQKWWAYEVDRLIPYITNGPLLFLGFWNKKLGILGALGSTATFISTVTIIPFMPEGWDAAAGGFPAMTGNVPFLMKDVVLLAVSVYLLRQDVLRELRSADMSGEPAQN